MKNHSKSIVVIIVAFLMAISAPEAFAQGKVTRPKKQSTVQTQKPKKNKQKQTKPKPKPKQPKQTNPEPKPKPTQEPPKQTNPEPKPEPTQEPPRQTNPEPKPEPTQEPPKPVQVSKPLSGFINGHESVDLGLSSGLKWATCNVGASSPEDYGDYYGWAETGTKTDYSGDTSATYGKSLSGLRSAGIINGSNVLTESYDVARFNWGSTWRMPTKAEMEELLYECTWTWTTQEGTNGYKVTGPNGKSIFLPVAGGRLGSSLIGDGEYGCYWSSSAYDDTVYAYDLYFYSGYRSVAWGSRDSGFSVRPVSE